MLTKLDDQKAMGYITSLGIQSSEAERNLQGLEYIVIKIGGECLNGNITELTRDIAILNQFGRYPLIIHGGGLQIDYLMHNTNTNKTQARREGGDDTVLRFISESELTSFVDSTAS